MNSSAGNLEKLQYLQHCCSDKGFKGTLVKRALYGGSLEITLFTIYYKNNNLIFIIFIFISKSLVIG